MIILLHRGQLFQRFTLAQFGGLQADASGGERISWSADLQFDQEAGQLYVLANQGQWFQLDIRTGELNRVPHGLSSATAPTWSPWRSALGPALLLLAWSIKWILAWQRRRKPVERG